MRSTSASSHGMLSATSAYRYGGRAPLSLSQKQRRWEAREPFGYVRDPVIRRAAVARVVLHGGLALQHFRHEWRVADGDGISDGPYPSPSIRNRMASSPTKEYLVESSVPSINDFRILTITCSILSPILLCTTGDPFGRSLYHSFCPVR